MIKTHLNVQAIKQFVAILLVTLTFGSSTAAALPLAVSNMTYFSSASTTDACAGLQQLSGGTCGATDTSGQSTVDNLVSVVVNILSWVVGVAAVIMIIYSGFRYITSGGDASRISGAKSTLIYALVGIVIVALAQLIVHFTLNEATTATAAPATAPTAKK